MGLGDFFKNIFGKKACAFCGNEVGMLKRTKIRNGDFICSDCDDMCSHYIKKYRYTKDELLGHMEYMKRNDTLYKEYVGKMDSELYPTPYNDMAIRFFDEAGMFIIHDRRHEGNGKKEYPTELFRYDTVASYEPYLSEDEPTEQGKEKVFKECGIKIKFVGSEVNEEIKNGRRAHPYIRDEVKIVFANTEREKETAGRYVDNAISHFDRIFGVNDDREGLFRRGMTKKEKRDLAGAIGFAKTAVDAVKAAKEGGISEEKAEEIKANINAVQDAVTDGLGVYTRRADELEDKLN